MKGPHLKPIKDAAVYDCDRKSEKNNSFEFHLGGQLPHPSDLYECTNILACLVCTQ